MLAIEKMMKPNTLEPLALRFYRIWSPYLTLCLARVGISPNAVSTGSILMSVAAGVLLGLNHPLAAALVLVAGHTFDRCDGELARYTDRCSLSGMYLSALNGNITYGAILLGSGCGAYLATGMPLYLYAGMSAILFKYLCRLNDKEKGRLLLGKKRSPTSGIKPPTILRRISWEAFMYVIHSYGMIISLLVLSLLGRFHYLPLFYGVLFPLQFIVQLILHQLEFKKINE